MDSHSPTPLVISWLIDIVPLNTLDSYRSDVWSALDLNLEVFRFFSANGRSLLLFAQVSRKWKSFAIKYTQVLPKASEFLPGSIALVPFWTSLQELKMIAVPNTKSLLPLSQLTDLKVVSIRFSNYLTEMLWSELVASLSSSTEKLRSLAVRFASGRDRFKSPDSIEIFHKFVSTLRLTTFGFTGCYSRHWEFPFSVLLPSATTLERLFLISCFSPDYGLLKHFENLGKMSLVTCMPRKNKVEENQERIYDDFINGQFFDLTSLRSLRTLKLSFDTSHKLYTSKFVFHESNLSLLTNLTNLSIYASDSEFMTNVNVSSLRKFQLCTCIPAGNNLQFAFDNMRNLDDLRLLTDFKESLVPPIPFHLMCNLSSLHLIDSPENAITEENVSQLSLLTKLHSLCIGISTEVPLLENILLNLPQLTKLECLTSPVPSLFKLTNLKFLNVQLKYSFGSFFVPSVDSSTSSDSENDGESSNDEALTDELAVKDEGESNLDDFDDATSPAVKGETGEANEANRDDQPVSEANEDTEKEKVVKAEGDREDDDVSEGDGVFPVDEIFTPDERDEDDESDDEGDDESDDDESDDSDEDFTGWESEHFEALGKMTSLTKLSFTMLPRGFDPNLLFHLTNLVNLTHIEFSGCHATNVIVNDIGRSLFKEKWVNQPYIVDISSAVGCKALFM